MRYPIYVVSIVCLIFVASCKKTGSKFDAGPPNITIAVAEPFTLAGYGNIEARLDNDRASDSPVIIEYSVFAPHKDITDKKITAHVHTLKATLARKQFIFTATSLSEDYTLSTHSEVIDTKEHTVQTLLFPENTEWFSSLWGVNGFSSASGWLALRWIHTTSPGLRTITEYREPLPACLKNHAAYSSAKKAPVIDSITRRSAQTICGRDLRDFTNRAYENVALSLPLFDALPLPPARAEKEPTNESSLDTTSTAEASTPELQDVVVEQNLLKNAGAQNPNVTNLVGTVEMSSF